MVVQLTPAQKKAADAIERALPRADVLRLQADAGAGKTTLLRQVHAVAGGAMIGVREFMDALATRRPGSLEEAAMDWMELALADHELVFVDDLHLLEHVTLAGDYPRTYLLDAALTAILDNAQAGGKTLVFSHTGRIPAPLWQRALLVKLERFEPTDYQAICRVFLPSNSTERLDFSRIHAFAPALNAHQLKNASIWLSEEPDLDTNKFTEYLSSQNLTSNVEIEEVEAVQWRDLKGVDDVIQELEAKVALPFENVALAAELRLKPKRGVLLSGPPGTGKTTIGRALAHRLKSKFFLIDGTMIAGSGDFYCKVDEVFDAAKKNAPSIVFIDDADVIFRGDQEERGLYRYLLTMMDGLESASAARVCVMLTAMDPASLPAALLRSGRVELWLETRLPHDSARKTILAEKIAEIGTRMGEVDIGRIAASSNGLTGADLKAAVEDAKLLFAHDLAGNATLRPPEDYFLEAIETIRRNRRSYARPKRSSWSEVKFGFEVSSTDSS